MIEIPLRNLLLSNTELKQYTADRIDKNVSDSQNDYLTYFVVSVQRPLNLDDSNSIFKARVQIDCYSKNHARDMAEALITQLHGKRNISAFRRIDCLGENPTFENETQLERISLDFKFQFMEHELNA